MLTDSSTKTVSAEEDTKSDPQHSLQIQAEWALSRQRRQMCATSVWQDGY